jgi:hypothetical protein
MALRIGLTPAGANAEEPEKPSLPLSRNWIWHILYILYSLEAGSFLIVFPWMRIWEENYFLYRYPDLHSVISNLFIKGAVMGLGLVNIIIGVQEFVRLKKGSQGFFSQ